MHEQATEVIAVHFAEVCVIYFAKLAGEGEHFLGGDLANDFVGAAVDNLDDRASTILIDGKIQVALKALDLAGDLLHGFFQLLWFYLRGICLRLIVYLLSGLFRYALFDAKGPRGLHRWGWAGSLSRIQLICRVYGHGNHTFLEVGGNSPSTVPATP